jgi:CheY-like chemotaxis protein
MVTRILIIEDDASIQEFMSMALTDEGYDVAIAPDGLAALSLVQSIQPQLIFLDMFMPIMDGQTFLERYRQMPDTGASIIALSASNNLEKLASMITVDGYLAKPFDLDALLAVADHYLRPAQPSSTDPLSHLPPSGASEG